MGGPLTIVDITRKDANNSKELVELLFTKELLFVTKYLIQLE